MAYGHADSCNYPGSPCNCDMGKPDEPKKMTLMELINQRLRLQFGVKLTPEIAKVIEEEIKDHFLKITGL